jgi:hypothetical protein
MNFIPQVCSDRCFEWLLRRQDIGNTRFVTDFIINPKRRNDTQQQLIVDSPIEWIIPVSYYLPSDIVRIDKSIPEFRSDYERHFATWLDRHAFKWAYEPLLFNNNYVPDFMINYRNIIVFLEVKGLWQPRAYAKIKRFSDFCAGYNMRYYLITQDTLRRIGVKTR